MRTAVFHEFFLLNDLEVSGKKIIVKRILTRAGDYEYTKRLWWAMCEWETFEEIDVCICMKGRKRSRANFYVIFLYSLNKGVSCRPFSFPRKLNETIITENSKRS